MSRQRSTWTRTAAMPKKADPYLMNQDHVSKNPRADKYMNGTPSSWAEDVHTPNEWEKEYAGGTTKRNEVGEPEFRPETFNHQEYAKSASANDGLILKKADLAVKVARMFLPKASEQAVEDQAVALMALPDSDLIATHNRLANDEEGQQGQQAPAEQQQQATVQTTAQAQEGQGQQEPAPQQQQAGAQDQQTQQAGMQQQSAYQTAMQQCMEAAQQGDQQKMQAAIQQMVQSQMQQQSSQADFPGGEWGHNNPVASKKPAVKKAQGDQGQGQGQQAPAQQQQQAGMQDQTAMQQQIQAMVDQAVQSALQQQMANQQQVQEQVQEEPAQEMMQAQASDDDLLDNMLAPPTAAAADQSVAGLGDIQLEPSTMDVGEISMGPEDDVLKTLFANQESEDAQKAQEQGQQQHQANIVRTAATRTVGTKPTAGVSRVGGGNAAQNKTAADKIDQLSSLWASAPDVREHFGIR